MDSDHINRLRSMVVSTQDTIGGEPRIIGTRLSINDIVSIYINDEFDDYPHLNKDDCIQAAVLYMYDENIPIKNQKLFTILEKLTRIF